MSANASPRAAYVLALGGLLVAIAWLAIVVAGFVPTGRLFLYVLSSFPLLVAWIELGPRYAVALWIAVSCLAMAYPGVQATAVYGLFFGPAPLLSMMVERHVRGWAGAVVRHSLWTIQIGLILLLFGVSRLLSIMRNVPVHIAVPIALGLSFLALQVFFYAYDFFLRAFSTLWVERLRPLLTHRSS